MFFPFLRGTQPLVPYQADKCSQSPKTLYRKKKHPVRFFKIPN